MFWPKIHDPVLGTLRRRWRCWRAAVALDGVPKSVAVNIQNGCPEDVDVFIRRAKNVVTRFPEFRASIAQQLFEDYCLFKQADLDNGAFTEADYRHHPEVTSPQDVWRVVTPFEFWVGHTIDRYLGNAYVVMDVDWPNPHYFQVCLELGESTWEHRLTEFVG